MVWQVFGLFPAGKTLSSGCLCAEAQSPWSEVLTISPITTGHPEPPRACEHRSARARQGDRGCPRSPAFLDIPRKSRLSSSRVRELPTPRALAGRAAGQG